MLYGFELDCNSIEASKNICFAIGDGAVDHTAETKWFGKASRPKRMDSEAVLQAREPRSESIRWDWHLTD